MTTPEAYYSQLLACGADVHPKLAKALNGLFAQLICLSDPERRALLAALPFEHETHYRLGRNARLSAAGRQTDYRAAPSRTGRKQVGEAAKDFPLIAVERREVDRSANRDLTLTLRAST
jgi:hypothetical protein